MPKRGRGRSQRGGKQGKTQSRDFLKEDVPPIYQLGSLTLVQRSPSPTDSLESEFPQYDESFALGRLPPLLPASGPPINIEGLIGGA